MSKKRKTVIEVDAESAVLTILGIALVAVVVKVIGALFGV